jgi:hypothetical protein
MAVKMFLPKMGSNAKPEMNDDVQKNAESAAPVETPVVEDAPESANNPAIEEAADTKPSKPASPKKTFLPNKFNFSPGRKSKKEPDAVLFNVSCEAGPCSGDCDDESVEVNMAAAEKGIDINHDDDDEDEEEKVESLPTEQTEVATEMTALQKLKNGSDDDDIDLKELAAEIKGKFKGMFRKNKSDKPDDSDQASPDEVAKSETNAADPKGASDEQVKNDDIATTPKKATFMSKLFKSDDKSEKTAPSEEEMHVDGEAAAAQAGESANTEKGDSEVKDTSTEKPAPKPGMGSKLTKLFSKNNVTSADATKNETGNEEAQQSAGVSGSEDLAEASASKQEEQAVADTEEMEDQKKASGKTSKFMKKLGFAGAAGAGAVGVAAAKASTQAKQGVADTEQKDEKKNEAVQASTEEEQDVAEPEQNDEQKNGAATASTQEQDAADTEQNDERKNKSGTKSKFMKKLGFAGAVKASDATDDKQVQVEESDAANENKPEEQAVADPEKNEEQKNKSGTKSKFLRKLGFAGGAVGAAAVKASDATDDKPVEESDSEKVNKDIESVEEMLPEADADEAKEQKKEKGFKSKFMKRLGFAGAAGAGAVGVAAAKSNNESSLEVIVHGDKPVSEAQSDGPDTPQAQAGGDETNATLDQVEDDEGSIMDKRTDADHSRCGFGDDIHEALMQAGEYMYEVSRSCSDTRCLFMMPIQPTHQLKLCFLYSRLAVIQILARQRRCWG